MSDGAGLADALLLVNVGGVLTMDGPDTGRGRARSVTRQGALFARRDAEAILVVDGRVAAFGSRHALRAAHPGVREWDAGGGLATPGLVDAHTHLLYAGSRAQEVALRARGATYLEILHAGGGILSTVASTRRASDADILAATRTRLARALAAGTTTVEIKTGYDLTPEGERRLLRLVRALGREGPQRVVATYLGAHAVPPEYGGHPEAYLDRLAEDLPAVVRDADFVDIFCEPGVFEIPAARRYLDAARRLGARLKLHVDELTDAGGAALAVELGAVSADHLAFTEQDGLARLAASDTVAVLLPGTAAYLNQGGMARGRDLLDRGGLAAVASDGNPGSSPTATLSPLMPWACAWLRWTPEEMWAGVTRVGAQALGRPDVGRLEPGCPADIVVWDSDDYRVPCYEYGVNHAVQVFVGGRPVAHPRA